jgi:hypothetical protein
VFVTSLVESAEVQESVSALVDFDVAIQEAVTGAAQANAQATFDAMISELGIASDSILARYLWELINDTQTVAWQNIASQSATSWQSVNTSANTDWTPIETIP